MKQITILMDESEILILRGQVRMLQIMDIDESELMASYTQKILQATEDIDFDTRKEIGKLQRAMRRIKASAAFPFILTFMKSFGELIQDELNKENFPFPPEL